MLPMTRLRGNIPGFLLLPRYQAGAFLCVCFWMSLGAIWSPWVKASSGEGSAAESQIKAAMLYKFLSYTTWPEAAFATGQSPYRVWVIGASDMESELRSITADRVTNHRPIHIFHASNVRRIKKPHVVFVGRSAEKHLPVIVRMAEQEAFLVVTESDEGLKPGSAINLRLIDGRIGFDVSLAAAKKSNLKLSARLLSVASTIEQEGR